MMIIFILSWQNFLRDMIKLNQAVVLAGGRGERLRPLTDEIPKPLVAVNGAPFLDYLINSVIQGGIKHILILTGYKGEAIIKRYEKLAHEGIEIECFPGRAEDHTGRRLLNARRLLDNYFLLLYGDNYWPMELKQMLNLYDEKKTKVLTTVFTNKRGTGEYGYENNISVGKDKLVRAYNKSRKSSGLNGVDIGYFIVNKNILNLGINENISFEEHILPRLILKKQLTAYLTDKQYYYITNLGSLKNFESAVAERGFESIPNNYFKGR